MRSVGSGRTDPCRSATRDCQWRTILADVWCHPTPLNVQINRMYKHAFAPTNNYRLLDCGPPGGDVERYWNRQTPHDAGRSAMNRARCSLLAFWTPHAASILPLQACYGGGLFHAEAGDLRGQLLPDPRTGSGASMSPGDATDLSMSPPTTRQISNDSWGGRRPTPGFTNLEELFSEKAYAFFFRPHQYLVDQSFALPQHFVEKQYYLNKMHKPFSE